MSDEVWLKLSWDHGEQGGNTEIGVPRDEALKMDRRAFARLYRKTVYGSKHKEANAWAEKQIAEREEVLGG